MKPRKRIRRQSKQPMPLLKRKTWAEFSQYVRRKNADFYGIAQCITCDTKGHWKDMNAGHYEHGKLDFDEMNVNVQCVRCNKWLHGNLGNYNLKLIEKYGIDIVKDLKARAKMAVVEKYSRQDLEDIYLKYKTLNEKFQ